MFSEKDKQQIIAHGLSLSEVQRQLSCFSEGFPPVRLSAPATPGSGILQLPDKALAQYQHLYEKQAKDSRIVKFVPASGAATRMFRALYAFVENYDGSDRAYASMTSDQTADSVYHFFKNLEKFAFYGDLKKAYKRLTGIDLREAHLRKQYVSIIDRLLGEPGLGYGSLPKGLLKFHRYPGSARTPVEEHLDEGCQYASCRNGEVNLHFTVSPEHQDKFDNHVSAVCPSYEDRYGTTIEVTYSTQDPATDTLAVDSENRPFYEEEGRLLFRPAGHGALLQNLNAIEADYIFIKNIDNVVPDRLRKDTIVYKKALCGLLIEVQQRVFGYLSQLSGKTSGSVPEEIHDFVSEWLGVRLNDPPDRQSLIRLLDRPIRVCGMVRNLGEPGGGPFWVHTDGRQTLQIVETAQIDLSDPTQKAILDQSTHFNPVDLVCAVKNYRGQKFDLMKFCDPMTGFITHKSKDGRELKALELPGLWNGSMAHWNTIFVEVPVSTFNPVKTVMDLLKPAHQ